MNDSVGQNEIDLRDVVQLLRSEFGFFLAMFAAILAMLALLLLTLTPPKFRTAASVVLDTSAFCSALERENETSLDSQENKSCRFSRDVFFPILNSRLLSEAGLGLIDAQANIFADQFYVPKGDEPRSVLWAKEIIKENSDVELDGAAVEVEVTHIDGKRSAEVARGLATVVKDLAVQQMSEEAQKIESGLLKQQENLSQLRAKMGLDLTAAGNSEEAAQFANKLLRIESSLISMNQIKDSLEAAKNETVLVGDPLEVSLKLNPIVWIFLAFFAGIFAAIAVWFRSLAKGALFSTASIGMLFKAQVFSLGNSAAVIKGSASWQELLLAQKRSNARAIAMACVADKKAHRGLVLGAVQGFRQNGVDAVVLDVGQFYARGAQVSEIQASEIQASKIQASQIDAAIYPIGETVGFVGYCADVAHLGAALAKLQAIHALVLILPPAPEQDLVGATAVFEAAQLRVFALQSGKITHRIAQKLLFAEQSVANSDRLVFSLS